MQIIRHLYRQPMRTIAVLLLLCISCTFFHVSFNVWTSAWATADAIQKEFTTIGLPSNRKEAKEVTATNGMTFTLEQSIFTSGVREYIEQLSETNRFIKGIYYQKFISAWSSKLHTVTSTEVDGQYKYSNSAPYHEAVFVIELVHIGEVSRTDSKVSVNLTANIEEAVALHPSFALREHLNINCIFEDEAAYEAAQLKTGKHYLIYGDYQDSDLALRTSLTQLLHCSVNEINWDNITQDTLVIEGGTAWYTHGDHQISLSDKDLTYINAGSLISQNRGVGYAEGVFPHNLDGTTGTIPCSELFDNPIIVPLTTTLEEFLSTPEAEEWVMLIDEIKKQYQCVPVLGTDMLECLYSFSTKEAFLVEGQTFTSEDYAGNTVCIIPESIAQNSNLSVGDRIDLSFYWGAEPYDGLTNANLTAQNYSYHTGMLEETKSYTIGGIYRHTDTWNSSSYSFNPNTIFVPNSTLPELTYTGTDGIFYSVVLENGTADEVQNLLQEQGYPEDILLYFDQGYSDIEEAMDSFRTTSNIQFIIATVVWFAALLLYLLLFVHKQQQTAGLMLSLGAGKQQAFTFWWVLSVIPVLIATCIASLCSKILVSSIFQTIFAAAFETTTAFSNKINGSFGNAQNTLSFSLWNDVIAILLQFVAFVVIISIFLRNRITKSPLELMK